MKNFLSGLKRLAKKCRQREEERLAAQRAEEEKKAVDEAARTKYVLDQETGEYKAVVMDEALVEEFGDQQFEGY
jgi:hypothetical protein